MATATINSTASGKAGLKTSNKATWADAHDVASADTETSYNEAEARKDAANNWGIVRGTCPFDLSSIPTGSIINSATFKFTYVESVARGNADTVDLDVVLLSSMADSTNAAVGDYNKFGTAVGGSKAYSAVVEGSYANEITLNATALAWIQSAIGGWLLTGVRCSRDTDNSAPTGLNYLHDLTEYQIAINYTPTGGGFLFNLI
jgi:hypothetical protein